MEQHESTHNSRSTFPSRNHKIMVAMLIIGILVVLIHGISINNLSNQFSIISSRQETIISTASASEPLASSRNIERKVEETARSNISLDPYIWINSGGIFYYGNNGVANTIQGDLPKYSFWRMLYALTNPTDTDSGYHPQNIFRLVTRDAWKDSRQQAYFNITKDNLSKSPNRNASNGVFLFNRYQDSDNLYYAGLRVDGAAVLKKKYDGRYYTMTYKPLLAGKVYNRSTNPSLIPKNAWIGLKTETTNTDNGVRIEMFIDLSGNGAWVKYLEVHDRGQFGKTPPITHAGYSGIRTDFADVLIKDFPITDL